MSLGYGDINIEINDKSDTINTDIRRQVDDNESLEVHVHPEASKAVKCPSCMNYGFNKEDLKCTRKAVSRIVKEYETKGYKKVQSGGMYCCDESKIKKRVSSVIWFEKEKSNE